MSISPLARDVIKIVYYLVIMPVLYFGAIFFNAWAAMFTWDLLAVPYGAHQFPIMVWVAASGIYGCCFASSYLDLFDHKLPGGAHRYWTHLLSEIIFKPLILVITALLIRFWFIH